MKKAINYLFSVLSKGAMKSVISDRGKEVACHNRIKDELKIDFFFADVYAPWQKRGIFLNGTSIKERSEKANSRNEFGHWELDSILSSRGESKSVIFTYVERKSRLLTTFTSCERTSNAMKKALSYLFSVLSKGAMKSVISDRGKEFACHNRIKDELKIDFFFADVYAPKNNGQRGSNENTNGLLREFYPKQTNLSKDNSRRITTKIRTH